MTDVVYKGDVTITIKKKGQPTTVRHAHNSGTSALFNQLAMAMAGQRQTYLIPSFLDAGSLDGNTSKFSTCLVVRSPITRRDVIRAVDGSPAMVRYTATLQYT